MFFLKGPGGYGVLLVGDVRFPIGDAGRCRSSGAHNKMYASKATLSPRTRQGRHCLSSTSAGGGIAFKLSFFLSTLTR